MKLENTVSVFIFLYLHYEFSYSFEILHQPINEAFIWRHFYFKHQFRANY